MTQLHCFTFLIFGITTTHHDLCLAWSKTRGRNALEIFYEVCVINLLTSQNVSWEIQVHYVKEIILQMHSDILQKSTTKQMFVHLLALSHQLR